MPGLKAAAAGATSVGVLILILCLWSGLTHSAMGILLTEDAGSGETLRATMREISGEFLKEIDSVRASTADSEVKGTQTPWRVVLAVYAVKTVADPENPQEVLRMTEENKMQLREVFWDMNVLSSETFGSGDNETALLVEIQSRNAAEMADRYSFSQSQRDQLNALLSAEDDLWLPVLYGAETENGKMVSVAISQLGNAGGQPYWSWYGFSARVDWCACFVSWCADQCGYLEDGTLPQFAWCPYGVEWFWERGLWADRNVTPEPGMIVFFDWDGRGSAGPQDGIADHTGIVERVEDGIVWTVEGNRGDSCREMQYPIGHYEILGYGMRRQL